MGVLCDVYIADRKRAPKYNFSGKCNCKNWQSCKCWDEYKPETYEYIDSHRIYAHDFAQLLSILRGKKYKAEANEEFKIINQVSDEGPWIQKVPADLPKLLAALTKEELKPVAKLWGAQISPGEPVPTKVILDYLKLLRKLCQKSIELKQNMYLWTCL